MGTNKNMQGEGNYDAAKKFNDAEKKFVDSGKVDQAARDAEPKNSKEEADMQRAEAIGRSHAKTTGSDKSEIKPKTKTSIVDLPKTKDARGSVGRKG